MKVITPVAFKTSHLLSTTATETYPTYSAGTTYSIGQKVVYGLTDIYESLINSNTGNQPDINPTKWLRIGPSNKYAMFDNGVSTQTTATSTLSVSIRPNVVVGSIAFLNVVNVGSITVQLLDAPAGNEVYNKTFSMDLISVSDWYSYFFSPFDLKDSLVITDIPLYSTAVINITFTGSGTIGVGVISYGSSNELGDVQYGATFGIKDFSIKDTDDFGNTVFVKRSFSKRMESSLLVDNSKLRFLFKTLNDLRATPTVWIGSEDITYEPLIMYGYYRDYDIEIAYPSASLVRLSIEGLI